MLLPAWLSEVSANRRLRQLLKILPGKFPQTMVELNRKVSLNDLVINSYFELSVKVMSLCW
jgi:hypothetical protein